MTADLFSPTPTPFRGNETFDQKLALVRDHFRVHPVTIDPVASFVEGPLLSPPAEYTGRPLQRVFGYHETLGDSVAQLYYYSAKSCAHVEGPAAVWALLESVPRLHPDPMTRASDLERCKRIEAVAALSAALFERSTESVAVILYGSAVRGKLNPTDYDLVIATRSEEEYEKNEKPKSIWSLATAELAQLGDLSRFTGGIPVHSMIFTHYHKQRTPLEFARTFPNSSEGLAFLGTGPFFAFLKNEQDPSSPRVFFNDSGRSYQSVRKE